MYQMIEERQQFNKITFQKRTKYCREVTVINVQYKNA